MRTQRVSRNDSVPTISYLEELARADRERRIRTTTRKPQPAPAN
ncbi:hypothetical protein [Streptosporangium sp. KLBMP 9127]